METEPTLFVELVDRSQPDAPLSRRRVPVCVRVDTDHVFVTSVDGRDGFNVIGADVDGKHRLEVGDIVVAYDWDDSERAWLAKVADAKGIPAERFYTLITGLPTTFAQWVSKSDR